ncbi:HpsJ family protein [Synechococcus sp. BA-132 BA5]|nr:HpsJ family protein [Synechococcus sp. BA-132 BA5]
MLLARILSAASSCLLVVFLAAALAALLPIRFTDPTWQLGVTSSLVNNGSFALISLVLLHFAADLEPANGRWQARCITFRQLAIAATLGFLLVVPLHAFSTWRAIAASEAATNFQQRQVTETFGALREAIRTAPTLGDLQARLRRLNGPTLQAADLAKPLPQLRQQLLVALQQAESTVQAQLPASDPERTWGSIKDSARVVVSALAFAFAFGAAACLPGASHPFWEGPVRELRKRLKARQFIARKQRDARESSENASRFKARQDQRRKAWEIDRKRKAEAKRRQRGR